MATNDTRHLHGRAIRKHRTNRKMTLHQLATATGLSVSYLSMVEKNRRQPSADAMQTIASALNVDPDNLLTDANDDLADRLFAWSRVHGTDPALLDPGSIHDITEDHAPWAMALLQTHERYLGAVSDHQQLRDRLALDPEQTADIHDLLTHIAANRSAVEILETSGSIPTEDYQRFFEIVKDESRQLSEIAAKWQARLTDAHDTIEISDATQTETAMDASTDIRADVDALTAELPDASFLDIVLAAQYDLQALARLTGRDVVSIAKRLVVLQRSGQPTPKFALFVVDQTGHPLVNWPALGLTLPHSGMACPLWVLFQAASSTDQVMVQRAEMPDGARYLFVALSSLQPVTGIIHRHARQTLMLACEEHEAGDLVYNRLAPTGPEIAEPVGVSCTYCPRKECPARR